MRTPLWALILVSLGFIGSAVLPTCSKSGENLRTIGCITALTGNDANYGRSTRQGLELALEEVNEQLVEQNAGYAYRIIFEDDQMSPKEGPGAYQKLTTVNRVPMIIGPFGSKVVMAVAPLAERGKTVLISASATSDNIADAGDFIFRTVPPNRLQARDCSNFALARLNAKSAFILYVNDEYGVTLKTAFEESFVKGGGQILGEDAYQSQDTDFRTQLTRIKSMNPDFVFFPGYYKEPALILKQASDLGLQEAGIKFVGTDGSLVDDLIKLAGTAAEGCFFSNLAADFESTDPAMRAFVSSYRREYNAEPDAYSAYYFDTFMMLGKALASIKWEVNNTTVTAERIKQALYNMPKYDGITGSTKFDSNGEVAKPFTIMVVRDGRFQLY